MVRTEVSAAEGEGLWVMYERAFDDLRAQAVQRHLLTRAEFAGVLGDTRVGKFIVRDPVRGGRACGLATLTNELPAVSLVSPEYFAARWPDLFRRNLIWYIGFLAVDPDYQGTGVLAELIGRLCAEVSSTGGVIAADICEYNEESLSLPSAFARLARTFTPGIRKQRLDAQVYWAFEFPAPA